MGRSLARRWCCGFKNLIGKQSEKIPLVAAGLSPPQRRRGKPRLYRKLLLLRAYAARLLDSCVRKDSGRSRHEELVVVKVAIHASCNFRRFRPERRTSALQENHRHNASDVSVGVRGEPSEARTGARTGSSLA